MDRRTILKRLGAATAGTAAIAGGATATTPREVEIEGQTVYLYEDVDPEDIDLEGDICCPDQCDYRYCIGCVDSC